MPESFQFGLKAVLQLKEVVRQILHEKQTTTSERIPRPIGGEILLGKINGNTAECAIEDTTLWAGAKGDEAASTHLISSYNRLDKNLLANDWVFLAPLNNGYEVIQGSVCDNRDTPWCGNQANKFYLQSGAFTSTVIKSQATGITTGGSDEINGISWDGVHTPYCGAQENKLALNSGQFSSTVQTSLDVSSVDTSPSGISWNGDDTPWTGLTDKKLYLQSGQFTSTIKDSESVSGTNDGPEGISWDGTHTFWCGYITTQKLYQQSGKFDSTLKTSQDVSGTDTHPSGLSHSILDAVTSIPWSGLENQKLYKQLGFTSTLSTSEDVSGIDTQPTDINTNILTVG